MCFGHSKMTYLLCPSDPNDDMKMGLVFIRLQDIKTQILIINLEIGYRI